MVPRESKKIRSFFRVSVGANWISSATGRIGAIPVGRRRSVSLGANWWNPWHGIPNTSHKSCRVYSHWCTDHFTNDKEVTNENYTTSDKWLRKKASCVRRISQWMLLNLTSRLIRLEIYKKTENCLFPFFVSMVQLKARNSSIVALKKTIQVSRA